MFWDQLDVDRWTVAVLDQIAAVETGMEEMHRHLYEDAQLASEDSKEGRQAALRQTRRLLRVDTAVLFLVLAINDLGRALKHQPGRVGGHEDLLERARILRNVFEHWDETRANFAAPDRDAVKSVKAYKLAYPGQVPWAVAFNGRDYVIGGVLPVSEVKAFISAVERKTGTPWSSLA